MKKIYISLAFVILGTVSIFAQCINNPSIQGGDINPSPLAQGQNGTMFFTFTENGLDYTDEETDPLTITICLLNIAPLDGINSIGGTYDDVFDWQYDAGLNCFSGTQNQDILGGSGGTITVDFEQTTAYECPNYQMGFTASIQPPACMNGINQVNDDEESALTCVTPPTDDDGDGDPNDTDSAPNDPCVWTNNQVLADATVAWQNADCDGDGVTNIDEVDPDGDGTAGPNGTDPNDPCSLNLADVTLVATDNGDCDGDGVPNDDEINSGLGDPQTDPNDPCDYNVAEQGTPSTAWDSADCDGDGNPNTTDTNPVSAIANDDSGTAPFGQTTSIDILGNDDFLANDGNTITEVPGGTAQGTIVFDPVSGELDYTPTASEPGTTVTVIYEVCQGTVCDQATVTIDVPITDTDEDGDPDHTDPSPNDPCDWGAGQVLADATAAWQNADCDGDGVTNIDEVDPDGDGTAGPSGTDPNDPCSLDLADVTLVATDNGDCDGDGVTNADEINSGLNDPQTDPNDPCDYNVAEQGTPSTAWDSADCDGDGNPNTTDTNPVSALANDDSGTAPFGQTTSIDILGNDDFLANDGNTITEVPGGTAQGTIVFDPVSGELDYTPTASEPGTTVTVIYEVCQGTVCDQATVTIDVPGGDTDGDGDPDSTDPDPNDPCEWSSNQILSITSVTWQNADCDGDGVINIDEVDPDGDGTAGPNGTDPNDPCSLNLADVTLVATDNGDCDGDGVPNADEINSGLGDPQTDPNDPCDYNVAEQGTPSIAWNNADCDNDGNPNIADPNPTSALANDDSGTAPFGQTTSIDILGNDDFLANDGNTITEVPGGTAQGTIVFDPVSGELDYIPAATEPGTTVTVIYEVCQGTICDQATVTIDVPVTDTDGDGDPDHTDPSPNDLCDWGTGQVLADATAAWQNADCDGDGVTNIDEVDPDGDGTAGPNGTDPNDPCNLNLADVTLVATNSGDCDGDGVTNADEINSGLNDPQTDPNDPCDYNSIEITQAVTADQTGCACPDLSPIITVLPTSIQGISTLNVIIDVYELGSVDTDGLITVRIPSDSRLTFTYDSSASTIGFSTVDNANWNYVGDNGLFHTFTTNNVITSSGSSTFGFVAQYDPENTRGETTISSTIVPASGGECEFANNFDAEVIIYFD